MLASKKEDKYTCGHLVATNHGLRETYDKLMERYNKIISTYNQIVSKLEVLANSYYNTY